MARIPHSGLTIVDGVLTQLHRHDASTPPTKSKIAIVGVFPFLPSGELVAVAVERGIEVPSGHVERFDGSPAEAIRREAWEEARIKLDELVPVACFRMIAAGAPGLEKYVALYAAAVLKMHRFRRTGESRERVVLTPDELCARYRQNEAALLRELLAEAHAKLLVAQQERV